MTNEYLFDVKLFASIRVQADTIADARKLIKEHIQGADCNFGAWPDGSPILAEASIDDDELPLIEVNGECV